MRMLLLIIGWILTIGAIGNGLMAFVALYFIGKGGFADFGMSVDTLLAAHFPFMLWAKSAATAILPANVAAFFFAAPALVVFPLRAAVAGLLGAWALKAARGRTIRAA